jgi:hypothetical protein
VLGAVLQRLAQERKVLAENSMELLARTSSLEQEKTALLARNLELERSNQNLREAGLLVQVESSWTHSA